MLTIGAAKRVKTTKSDTISDTLKNHVIDIV
jgi:hypothetical protein